MLMTEMGMTHGYDGRQTEHGLYDVRLNGLRITGLHMSFLDSFSYTIPLFVCCEHDMEGEVGLC
jgi:hypothetical protein